MATSKWPDGFQSLTNQSAQGNGLVADISDLKQMDYGVNLASLGPISAGALVLETSNNPVQTTPWYEVINLDATALEDLSNRGFQSSGPKPFGKYARWRIATAIVGGTVDAFINGQHVM